MFANICVGMGYGMERDINWLGEWECRRGEGRDLTF